MRELGSLHDCVRNAEMTNISAEDEHDTPPEGIVGFPLKVLLDSVSSSVEALKLTIDDSS